MDIFKKKSGGEKEVNLSVSCVLAQQILAQTAPHVNL